MWENNLLLDYSASVVSFFNLMICNQDTIFQSEILVPFPAWYSYVIHLQYSLVHLLLFLIPLCSLHSYMFYLSFLGFMWGFPSGSVVKNLPAVQETCRRRRFNPWVALIYFLPMGEPYSPWFPSRHVVQVILASNSNWGPSCTGSTGNFTKV